MKPRPKCVLDVQGVNRLAVVCAWCPDKTEGEAWAEGRGLGVTHGLCDGCKVRDFPFAAEADAAKREGREPDYLSTGRTL